MGSSVGEPGDPRASAVAPTLDASGMVLAQKYQLTKLLGRGGMGSVWRARHLSLESEVAVKLVDPSIAANPEALARFMREAQSAAALRSPHVVQILDYGVENQTPYIVMELLEGENLADRLARLGPLSPAETVDIIIQVCRAVGRAHEQGIVHRDLKPENIYLTANDDVVVAKVLDFGIAKRSGMGRAHGMTQTGAVLGTPYYMSPEQAEGSKSVDSRSDLWSLAVIAFECLTGRRPFDADSLGGLVLAICTRPIPIPSTVAPVPSGFDAWFARGTAREIERRFASARELSTALRACCGVQGATGSPEAGRQGLGGFGSEPGNLDLGAEIPINRKLSMTSAASSMVRSADDDLPVDLPVRRLGLRWLLAGAGLILATVVVMLVVARTSSSSANGRDSGSSSGLGTAFSSAEKSLGSTPPITQSGEIPVIAPILSTASSSQPDASGSVLLDDPTPSASSKPRAAASALSPNARTPRPGGGTLPLPRRPNQPATPTSKPHRPSPSRPNGSSPPVNLGI